MPCLQCPCVFSSVLQRNKHELRYHTDEPPPSLAAAPPTHQFGFYVNQQDFDTNTVTHEVTISETTTEKPQSSRLRTLMEAFPGAVDKDGTLSRDFLLNSSLRDYREAMLCCSESQKSFYNKLRRFYKNQVYSEKSRMKKKNVLGDLQNEVSALKAQLHQEVAEHKFLNAEMAKYEKLVLNELVINYPNISRKHLQKYYVHQIQIVYRDDRIVNKDTAASKINKDDRIASMDGVTNITSLDGVPRSIRL